MTNAQLITLILTILGSNFAVLAYLGNRIDRVETRIDLIATQISARVDRVGDKLETINKALGKQESEIEHLKTKTA